jgi:O-antigen/teichoic acid export membrane protein
MSRLKQLGKDSLIYGIGGIFAKGVSFFLLPVYTRIVTQIKCNPVLVM